MPRKGLEAQPGMKEMKAGRMLRSFPFPVVSKPHPPDTLPSPASSLCILVLLGPFPLGTPAWLLMAALSRARYAPHLGGSWEDFQVRKDKKLDIGVGPSSHLRSWGCPFLLAWLRPLRPQHRSCAP